MNCQFRAHWKNIQGNVEGDSRQTQRTEDKEFVEIVPSRKEFRRPCFPSRPSVGMSDSRSGSWSPWPVSRLRLEEVWRKDRGQRAARWSERGKLRPRPCCTCCQEFQLQPFENGWKYNRFKYLSDSFKKDVVIGSIVFEPLVITLLGLLYNIEILRYLGLRTAIVMCFRRGSKGAFTPGLWECFTKCTYHLSFSNKWLSNYQNELKNVKHTQMLTTLAVIYLFSAINFKFCQP